MDQNIITQLKQGFTGALECCEKLNDAGAWGSELGKEFTPKMLLLCDLSAFISYFMISDGTVTEEEVALLCVFTDLNPDDALEVFKSCRNGELFNIDYLSNVPVIMLEVAKAELKLKSAGVELPGSLTEIFGSLFKLLAQLICASDGDVSIKEAMDCEKIEKTIDDFVAKCK